MATAERASGQASPAVPGSSARGRQSERLEWMDAVRGLAVLLVIIVHGGSVYGSYGFEVPAGFRAAGLAMAPYRIPLLVFLSGFLLYKSHAKGTADFVEGKFRNLAWPYVIWTIIFCLAAGEPSRLLHYSVWVGGSYLWYILFLGFFFLVSLLLRRAPYILLVVYALAVAMVMPEGSKYGQRLFMLMAMFFAGGIAGKQFADFTGMLAKRWSLWLIPLVIFMSTVSIVKAPEIYINYSPSYFPIILGCIVAICAIFYRVHGAAVFAPLRYIGRNSLVFYVVHVPVYVFLLSHHLLPLEGLPLLHIAALVIIALATSTLMVRLRERFKPANLLFVGPALGFRK